MASDIILPKLISGGMILQRNADVKIWGWSIPGKKINVKFASGNHECIADNDGKWITSIDTGDAGGPYEMEICSNDSSIRIIDILLGDVWVCSGQSNMAMKMNDVKELYAEEIITSSNPVIRQFMVPDRYDFNGICEDFSSGNWKSSNPENVLQFSAVAYFFAKMLFERYGVPIGLINASYGGAPIESFMSENSLKKFPEQFEQALKFKDKIYLSEVIKSNQKVYEEWHEMVEKNDHGIAKKWFESGYDDSSWETITLPSSFKTSGPGKFNGAIWLRKKIYVPSSMTGKNGNIRLGRIVDNDRIYINGNFAGTTSFKYPQRIYEIPEDLLKDGINTVAVRVLVYDNEGEFIKEKQYCITVDGMSIDLKGEWKYKISHKCGPLPSSTSVYTQPLGLYNGMISPLFKFTIKGVIWYQGESNISRPDIYKNEFFELVNDWRKNWACGEFPFLFVQLPNYLEAENENPESGWPILRNEQLKCLEIPNTGIAVTIDAGEWNDIHPMNKKTVGYRLAVAAGKKAYGENNLTYSGPIYKSMEISGNSIIISFENAENGLTTSDGKAPGHFEIAGSDGIYLKADAEIINDEILVNNKTIKYPLSVRYAWSDNPFGANLINLDGLPASPFITG